MSKSSEMALMQQQADYENVEKQEKAIEFMSEAEYILKKKKELDAYKADRKFEKMPIVQGIVSDIKEYQSKYGYSFAIILDGQSATRYYFNCKCKDTVDRMFQKGKKAAFTCDIKTSKAGNKVAVIDMVYYTFC